MVPPTTCIAPFNMVAGAKEGNFFWFSLLCKKERLNSQPASQLFPNFTLTAAH